MRLQTLGAKSAEKTIRNTGHSCSRQPAETDKHKEDELREYRREEMKTKIETWKCFVPAINKFGHVYILSYPCHVKFKNSVAQNQQHAGQEVSWQPSADKTPQRKDK